MTAAVRATILVITVLAGGIAAVIASIATRPALGADDPQSFWREVHGAPSQARGRARLMKRRHQLPQNFRYAANRRTHQAVALGAAGGDPAPAAQPSKFDRIASRGAFVVRTARVEPEAAPDSFKVRSELPLGYDRTLTRPWTPPLYGPPPPRPPERRPNNTKRMLCVASAIAVALGAAMASMLAVPRKRTAHV